LVCTWCRDNVNGIKRKKPGVIRKCRLCPVRSKYVQYHTPGVTGHVCLNCKRKREGWVRPKTFCFRCGRKRRCDYKDNEFEKKICWRCNKRQRLSEAA
jgi:hypothetical protein